MSAIKCPKHAVNHWCKGGSLPGTARYEAIMKPHCGAKHPDLPDVSCMRLKRHDGDCAAYAFSIITPTTWPVSA